MTDRQACWVKIKDGAALADALSTAVMIMSEDKVKGLVEKVEGTKVWTVGHDGGLQILNF